MTRTRSPMILPAVAFKKSMRERSRQFRLRPLVGCLCLLLALASPAAANSHLLRGTIVAVADGQVTIERHWENHGDDDGVETVRCGADAHVLLDGVVSTPAEAFVPGRLIHVCKDVALFKVFTADHRLAPAGEADPLDGWWQVRLEGRACYVEGVVVHRQGPKPATFQGPLVLYLDVADGAIRDAAVSTPGMKSSAAGHEVDAAGLRLSVDALAGDLRVVLRGNGKVVLPEAAAERTVVRSLQVSVGEDGRLAGSWEGRAGDREIEGTVGGRVRARPVIPEDCFLWVRCPRLYDRLKGADSIVELRRQDGAVEGTLLGGKDKAVGPLGEVTLTLTERTFAATVTCPAAARVGGMELRGRLIGDRIFGTWTTTGENGGRTGALRGEVRGVGCPTMAWNEADAKREVKALAPGEAGR